MVNLLSRLGSPEFHGTVYSFLNDRRLNARNFFDVAGHGGPGQIRLFDSGKPVALDGNPLLVDNPQSQTAPYTRLQSGFVLGGPLKFRHSASHTFFFTSFEKQNIHARQDANFAVPTVAERGIFGTGATGFSKVGSTRIPMTPDSLAGDAIFSLYPFPNNPSGPYGPNTYTDALAAGAGAEVASVKVDHYFQAVRWISAVTARYNITDESSVVPVTSQAIDSSLSPKLRTQNLATFLNSNFTPATTQTVRLSYGRSSSHFDPAPEPGLLPSQVSDTPFLLNAPLLLNVTNPNSAAPGYLSATSPTGAALLQSLGYGSTTGSEQVTGPLGQVNIAGFSPVGVDVFNFPQTRANNTFQWADTITHIHGRHTFTGGFDIRRSQLNSNLNRNARPLAQFGGLLEPTERLPLVMNQTCNLSDPSCVLAQGVLAPATLAAAGVPNGFFQTLTNGTDTSLGIRFTQYNFFLQDALFVTSNFRVTAGLRYEYNTAPHTVGDKLENSFNSQALYQEAVPVENMCPLRCAGLADYFKTIPDYSPTFGSDPWNLHPRVGFAWDVKGKQRLAIRGGFGTYSSPSPGVVLGQSRSAFPDSIPLNLANFSTLSDKGSYLFNLANPTVRAENPYLSGALIPGTLNQLYPGANPVELIALDLYSLRGSLSPSYPSLDLVLPAKNLRNPRSSQIGLTVEGELPGQWIASMAYVGTIGHSLFRLLTPQSGLNRSLVQFANDVTPVVGNASATGDVVFPFLSGVMQPPQPNPIANSFTVAPTIFDSSASSLYNSLQAQLRKSYSRGIQFSSAFTYSHAIDNASDFFDTAGAFALPQNSANPSERGSSGFDARLRSVTYSIWDLPGKGSWLGDWQFAGIFTAQTGQPYTINSIYDVNQDGNLTDRLETAAPLIAGSSNDPRIRLRLASGVNPFSLLAPLGGNGAVGRNTFQATGLESLDCALVKSFHIRESQKLAIRGEFFNALNHTNFGIPVRILEAPGFGASASTAVPARTVQLALKYLF